MGVHDRYGKRLLREAAGGRYHDGVGCCSAMCCTVDYLTAGGGRIDGTVDGDIAIEIEARKITQILGSLLKLLCHPYPKKLLLLLQANIDNPDLAQRQCNQILRKFLNQQDFRVILARGSGHDEHFEEDVTTVRVALAELSAVRVS